MPTHERQKPRCRRATPGISEVAHCARRDARGTVHSVRRSSPCRNLAAATERYYRQTTHCWLRYCAQRGVSDPRDVSPDHLTDYSAWLQAEGNNKQSVATWLRGVR